MDQYQHLNEEAETSKSALATFLKTMHRAFKILNSKTPVNANDDMYCEALGGKHYEDQITVLEKTLRYLETNKYLSVKPQKPNKKGKMPPPHKPRKIKFQRGAQITIKAIIALQIDLKEQYEVPCLQTARATQDFLERFFGDIRDMDSNRYPSAAQLVYRISRNLTKTLLKVLSSTHF